MTTDYTLPQRKADVSFSMTQSSKAKISRYNYTNNFHITTLVVEDLYHVCRFTNMNDTSLKSEVQAAITHIKSKRNWDGSFS